MVQVLMLVLGSHIVRAVSRCMCICLCVVGAMGTATAEPSEIIILPMTTTSKALNIYRNAVPSALARRLIAAGVHAQAIPTASDTPTSTKVIIDGRLVLHSGDRVQIEVHIRRASTGRLVTTLASDIAKSTDIETLVARLADRLGPVLNRALTTAPFRLPTTVVQGEAAQPQNAHPRNAHPQNAHPTMERQTFSVLLLPASGEAARGMIDVREPATEAALSMVRRLGVAVAHSTRHEGIASPLDVVAEMREGSNNYALMVQVIAVHFSYSSVLSARGHVRVVLVGADGLAVFDRSVETQTLVGARGDRHQALVYLVTEQALDILLPEFRRALPRGRRGA